MTKSRVLVADDQALLRHGLQMMIDAQPDLQVVGQAADGARQRVAVGHHVGQRLDQRHPRVQQLLLRVQHVQRRPAAHHRFPLHPVQRNLGRADLRAHAVHLGACRRQRFPRLRRLLHRRTPLVVHHLPQPLRISLTVLLDAPARFDSDTPLSASKNYLDLKHAATGALADAGHFTLIEAVADHICETLFLQDRRVRRVRVKIVKLAIAEDGEAIGITLVRHRR